MKLFNHIRSVWRGDEGLWLTFFGYVLVGPYLVESTLKHAAVAAGKTSPSTALTIITIWLFVQFGSMLLGSVGVIRNKNAKHPALKGLAIICTAAIWIGIIFFIGFSAGEIA